MSTLLRDLFFFSKGLPIKVSLRGVLLYFCTFFQGMDYFFEKGLVDNNPAEIAKFFHHTSTLSKSKMRQYLEGRHDVIKCMTELQNFENTFLPNALRYIFFVIKLARLLS